MRYRSSARVFRAGAVFADVRFAHLRASRVVPRWSPGKLPGLCGDAPSVNPNGPGLTLKSQVPQRGWRTRPLPVQRKASRSADARPCRPVSVDVR